MAYILYCSENATLIFNPCDALVTGVLDPATREEIRRAQARWSLPQTGRLNETSLNRLRRSV